MTTERRIRCTAAGVAAVLAAGVAVSLAQQQKAGPLLPGVAAQMQQQQMALEQAKTVASGQVPSAAVNPRPGSASPFPAASSDETPSYIQDSVRVKRNDERQKRLENDTQRLLGLANQLKTEVAASGAESMTPEMLRQMDEIEKLAKSVKDRMRN